MVVVYRGGWHAVQEFNDIHPTMLASPFASAPITAEVFPRITGEQQKRAPRACRTVVGFRWIGTARFHKIFPLKNWEVFPAANWEVGRQDSYF